MLLNPEDGMRVLDSGETPAKGDASPKPAFPSSAAEAVKMALAGTLPRDPKWEPTDGQPRYLGAQHIAMVMDRSLGYNNREIAAKHDYKEIQVGRVLAHPDSQLILGMIMGQLADNCTDVAERIKGYAHEALDTVVAVMRTTDEDVLKANLAKDLLDRAGYGARRKVDVAATARFELPTETAQQVASAAEAARRVASADYRRFLRSQSQEGGSPSASSAVSEQPGGTDALAVVEASLSDDSSEAAAA